MEKLDLRNYFVDAQDEANDNFFNYDGDDFDDFGPFGGLVRLFFNILVSRIEIRG